MHKKYKDFQFSFIKEWKPSKRETWKNFCQKIAENLDFVEYSNFIRRSGESVVRGHPGKTSKKKIYRE